MVFFGGGTFGPITATDLCYDRTEVTVAAYRACVTKGSCSAASTTELSLHQNFPRASECNWAASGRENHPINCVDLDQSTAYCAAQGKRLPSALEWFWVARGGALGRTYPWGEEAPSDTRLCWMQSHTCPVASFPAGASSIGLVDLSANVWERTSTMGPTAGSVYSIGGGFYETEPTNVSAMHTGVSYTEEKFHDVGFRCVKNL